MSKNDAKPRYFDEQYDDEEMLHLFRKHPVVMRKQIVIASAALLIGVIPSLFKPEFSWFFGGLGIGFALAFIIMFWAWMGWYFSVFIVTSQRLIQITQKGLFHRSFVDIGLDKIQSVNYEIKGLQETLLGFGTILIQTYIGDLVIHEVHHPKKMSQHISQVLRELNVTPAGVPAMASNDKEATETEE